MSAFVYRVEGTNVCFQNKIEGQKFNLSTLMFQWSIHPELDIEAFKKWREDMLNSF
jgi:hypothetical protein